MAQATDNLDQVISDGLVGATPADAEKLQRFSALQIAIAKKRDEAVAARKASGIEDTWRRCEEAYLGMDDLNRGEFNGGRWEKPSSMDGPITTSRRSNREEPKRSSLYFRMTSHYVDAGVAKLCEILLPADDKPFSFGPTPVPDLIKGREDLRQVMLSSGQPAMRDATAEEQAAMQAGNPAGAQALPPGSPAPQVPITVKDLTEENVELSTEKAKAAEKRIWDWMVECQHTAQMRKVLFDSGRIGVGVLKGPVPSMKRSKAIVKTKDGVALEIEQTIKPATKWVSPWNCYPDGSCGENTQDGEYFVERDDINEKQLRALKDDPTYDAAAIDRIIEEGPGKMNAGTESAYNDALGRKRVKHSYEIWYFVGTLNKDDLEAANVIGRADLKPNTIAASCICTMVNDTLIKSTVHPLESGEFEYHAIAWQRRPGHWTGVGLAEQVAMPQALGNSALRAMANNAGVSSGSQIIMQRGEVLPQNGSWTMTPDKIWESPPGVDVRSVFWAFMPPSVQAEMERIFQLALSLAERCTSVPLISQGQTGPTSPDTFGATQIQNDNANQLLRSIGYQVDDSITEPLIRQFYEWLLLDPDVPEEEKGDWEINAHGSAALVERAIQDQSIALAVQLSLNPAYGADPKKAYAQWLKSKHLQPTDFQHSKEEQAKLDAAPKPPPPAVAVAQIRAQADAAEGQADRAAEAEREMVDVHARDIIDKRGLDRDTAFVNAERERTQVDADARRSELAVKRELAMLDYANARQISLEQLRVELADTTLKLRVQERLSDKDHAHELTKQALTPPTEPAGKAPDGKAWTQ